MHVLHLFSLSQVGELLLLVSLDQITCLGTQNISSFLSWKGLVLNHVTTAFRPTTYGIQLVPQERPRRPCRFYVVLMGVLVVFVVVDVEGVRVRRPVDIMRRKIPKKQKCKQSLIIMTMKRR